MTSSSSIRNDFYRQMDALLNQPAGSVTGSELLQEFKEWDSLAVLDFMMMASSEFKSDVEPSDLAACKTVSDLADVVFASQAASEPKV